MKSSTAFSLLGAIAASRVAAVPTAKIDDLTERWVDEEYPYTGAAVPVGDWVNPGAVSNGKGFPRLSEDPAVIPGTSDPTNNINVISFAYIPKGIAIHYQTPFGLGVDPKILWGTSATSLTSLATGFSHTYDRTPPCSMAPVTQCSQFFHEVQIGGLDAETTYYYQISAANGTTESNVLSFTTARAAGNDEGFTIAVLNDMGYTNAAGTMKYINKAVDEGIAFAWHGGDISYADDWYSGILPCEDDWPVCYNGTSTELPGGFPIPVEYEVPLPEGEIANQGGPQGGDMSVIYESNWDLWQQWMVNITSRIPYMVLPGNHEASCGEFDGTGYPLTALLNNGTFNGTAPELSITYYSCPPSQRNFTAYQNRFYMAGEETGGVGNMWYSFDYGSAHFISLDGETDYASSPEWPFASDLSGNETHPTVDETYITDSGPFGNVEDYTNTKSYAQYQWLAADLAKIDRCKTPWVIAMSHRPFYSSQVSSYQKTIRTAFEALLLDNGVDAYLSGHIHWYERLFPMAFNGTIDQASVIDNNTYLTNPGVSMTHIINGMAGNIESHSTLDVGDSVLPLTAVLDFEHYGFNKINFINSTAMTFSFVTGVDGSVLDKLTLLKKPTNATCPGTGSTPPYGNSTSTSSVPVGGGTSYPVSVPTYTDLPSSIGYVSSSGGTIIPTTTGSSTEYTTSTVRTTEIITVVSCAPTVTDCP
ncbi:acid phosphatase AphA [Calycina marina]|uniref:Purple acid phosphatase n=1 Tax=Calycina marina TaxID=1763456 RepID=A0A9P8CGQ8_9HELO|nr:acid phosphatase AphA [Calycina marina]